jgi:hypothetical protein
MTAKNYTVTNKREKRSALAQNSIKETTKYRKIWVSKFGIAYQSTLTKCYLVSVTITLPTSVELLHHLSKISADEAAIPTSF